jgi:hypothetical protein
MPFATGCSSITRPGRGYWFYMDFQTGQVERCACCDRKFGHGPALQLPCWTQNLAERLHEFDADFQQAWCLTVARVFRIDKNRTWVALPGVGVAAWQAFPDFVFTMSVWETKDASRFRTLATTSNEGEDQVQLLVCAACKPALDSLVQPMLYI